MEDFNKILEEYIERFGHTFSTITLAKDRKPKVSKQMKLALAGKRGAITEKEANGDIPDNALI